MESISYEIEKKIPYGASYGWASPKKYKLKFIKKTWSILKKCFKKYCDNTSLAGLKYLTESHRPITEKILWIIVHITIMCTLSVMIYSFCAEYMAKPVETTVDSTHYPSDRLDFPAVAVCNINRISRQAAEKFAREIVDAKITNEPISEVLNIIKNLGNLYQNINKEGITPDMSKKVDETLKKLLGSNYNINETMFKLTPNCTNMILSCSFHNTLRNCSEIFEFRKTQDGYCCVFNYVRSRDIAPERIEVPGLRNGLSMVLEPNLNDYFYPYLPIIGFKVSIFNPTDYPENTSGGVSEALIRPLSEAHLRLIATSFFSTQDIKDVQISKRKCVFNDEVSVLGSGYTYSDCIVDCRYKSIVDLCKCIPFFFPMRDNSSSTKICSTLDIECLSKYKTKWWSVIPHNGADKESNDDTPGTNFHLYQQINDSLECHNCYPACKDVTYQLRITSARLNTGFDFSPLMNNIKVENHSVVHIYFTSFGGVRLKMDLQYHWYELLSDIGGTCGIFLGFSLISLVELIYFLVNFIGEVYHSHKNNLKKLNHKLYWNELYVQRNVKETHGIIQPRKIKVRY